MLKEIKKEGTSPSFKYVYFLKLYWYSSKCFADIYRAQYTAAILVYLRGIDYVARGHGLK